MLQNIKKWICYIIMPMHYAIYNSDIFIRFIFYVILYYIVNTVS